MLARGGALRTLEIETARLSSPIRELVYRPAFQKREEERSFGFVSRLRAALIALPTDEPYLVCPPV